MNQNILSCTYEHPREFIKLDDQEVKFNKNYSLIVINSKINNNKARILIDSGSEVSLINKNLVSEMSNFEDNVVKISKISLLGANNKKLCEVNQAYNLNVQLKDKLVNLQLLIIPHMDYDIVIGSDQLERYDSIIDYQRKKIRIDGVWMDFGDESQIDIKKVNINVVGKWENEGKYFNENIENINDEIIIDCNEKHYENIMKLINNYKGLVSNESRVAKRYVHRFEVKECESFKTKNYPIPYKFKDEVNNQIELLLRDGIVEKSNTPYINPVVIVKKKVVK